MSVHKKAATSKGGRNGSDNSSIELHPREVMLIRHLRVMGKSDYQIWKEYHITIPVIQKAKKEIERQAVEEFENKEKHAVELAKFKDRLKFVIDSMDAIANDKTVSHADRIKSEAVKLEALVMLRDAVEASKSSPDPHNALEKIVDQSWRRQWQHNVN
jgi:hypothetical protein